MASAAVSVAAGGASPLVHPLVLINVSDHFTRLKLVENAPHMEGARAAVCLPLSY